MTALGLLAAGAFALRSSGCGEDGVESLMKPPSGEARPGIAVAVVMDTSGSMSATVRGASGKAEPKIDIARRAAAGVVRRLEEFAAAHPDWTLRVGLWEFSARSGGENCRTLVPMGPADRKRAEEAVARMTAEGGTPIGDAMVRVMKDLDGSGLASVHLLLVTDGENTDGIDPALAAAALARRPEARRPAVYFVAFDVAASAFRGVKEAGATVVSASDEPALRETIDVLLGEKILIERPASK